MKHVRRICAVLLAAVVLLPIVLLCVQAFVPPFDALMISTGSEPLRLLPVPLIQSPLHQIQCAATNQTGQGSQPSLPVHGQSPTGTWKASSV